MKKFVVALDSLVLSPATVRGCRTGEVIDPPDMNAPVLLMSDRLDEAGEWPREGA